MSISHEPAARRQVRTHPAPTCRHCGATQPPGRVAADGMLACKACKARGLRPAVPAPTGACPWCDAEGALPARDEDGDAICAGCALLGAAADGPDGLPARVATDCRGCGRAIRVARLGRDGRAACHGCRRTSAGRDPGDDGVIMGTCPWCGRDGRALLVRDADREPCCIPCWLLPGPGRRAKPRARRAQRAAS